MIRDLGSELNWVTVKSYISAMDGDEVLRHFDTSFAQDYQVRRRLLERLAELRKAEAHGDRAIRDLIRMIDERASDLSASKARSADGTMSDLALMLDDSEQLAIAGDFVLHTRTSRRLSGYKIIRRHRGHGLKDRLAESYRRYRDTQALITLVFTGEDITDILSDPRQTIGVLRERYHQALAIERLWARDESACWRLAEEFPMAFIWAAGRRRETGAKDFVANHFRAALTATEHAASVREWLDSLAELRSLVWALGRVGGREHLDWLARKFGMELPWPSVSELARTNP